MSEHTFLSEAEEASVVAAIAAAELNTSGEIRVHLDKSCAEDPFERATALFTQLGMQATAARNGVLIYVAAADRKLAIIGDEGIDNVVPSDFWDKVRDLMISHFKTGDFAEGLSKGILLAGEQLKTHFPLQDDDRDELTNNLSFGDEPAN